MSGLNRFIANEEGVTAPGVRIPYLPPGDQMIKYFIFLFNIVAWATMIYFIHDKLSMKYLSFLIGLPIVSWFSLFIVGYIKGVQDTQLKILDNMKTVISEAASNILE